MAANTPTILALENIFSVFFTSHKFLNGFDFGGPDWNLDVNQVLFPYMYVETGASKWLDPDNNSFLTEEQTFKVYIIDRINKGDINYIDVLSDTKYALSTYLSSVNQSPYMRELGIRVIDSVNFTPLYEFSKDNCNGWVAEMSFRYPMRFDPCNAPMIPITSFTYSLNQWTQEFRLNGSSGTSGANGSSGSSGTSGSGTSGTSGIDGIYWVTVPGDPIRSTTSSLSVTDTSNTNLYDLLLSRGTVLKWTDTSVTKMGMIINATYSTNVVTITIIGDNITASASTNTLKYTNEKCRPIVFSMAGTIAVGTDLTGRYYSPYALKVFGADAYHMTAGTTNSTTYDINKNGTTMFTTKVSIASAATTGTSFTADDSSVTATSDYISVDCDSVSTTAPIDAYIELFTSPLNNIYLT